MEGRLHYICRVRLNGAPVFVVWYSGEHDGFLRDERGRLLAARTPDALTAEAEARGVALADPVPTDYDFDPIGAWCAAPAAAGVDCPAFLNAWNFFDDLAG